MMSVTRDPGIERLHDLLAERATQPLSRRADEELAELLTSHGDVDPDAYDLAAAAADVASLGAEIEPLPDRVRAGLETSAVAFLAEQRGLRLRPTSRAGVLPWLAAAAGVLLSVVAWWPATTASLATQRRALLDTAGTRTIAWVDNDAGVTGDVVWNNERQAGYMRISGVAVNDPDALQYQLWIFDERRKAHSDDVAVDGGVFDVSETGEVIVPIHAKLEVFEPVLFAVTTEPPGGVVKHLETDSHRIILTAPVSG